MNIKNRLEKLEKTTNLDSDFCTCPRAFVIRFIEPEEEEDQELTAEFQKREYCDRCQKQIENIRITIGDV